MKFFFLSFLALIFCASCHKTTIIKQEKIVASVGERHISLKEFSDLLTERLENYNPLESSQESIIAENKDDIINDFLYQSLITRWSQSQKIFVHPDQIQKEIKKIQDGYPDKNSFRKSLQESGQSYEGWKDKMQFTLLEKTVLKNINKILPAPDIVELKSFYKNNSKRFKKGESVKIRQLVFFKKAEAEKALYALRKNWSFSKVLKKYNDLKAIKIETDGSWLEKSDNFIYTTASSLKPKEYSSVVESIYGFHIIQLIDRKRGKTLSFEEVKNKIIEDLGSNKQQKTYIEWLKSEMKDTKILINRDLINSIKVKHGKH